MAHAQKMMASPADKAAENALVSRPFAADMFVVYVFDLPDGMRMLNQGDMASLGLDAARLWDLDTGKLCGFQKQAHTGKIYSLSFSPREGERLLVSASIDKKVKFWKIEEKPGAPESAVDNRDREPVVPTRW